MKFSKTVLVTSVTLALSVFQGAQAHTSFVIDATSIPFAGKSYTGTLRAGHGCADALGAHFDTERIEVEIPAGVTAVKPFDAPWGKATIEKDTAGLVTKLIWTRSNALPVLTADTHLYLATFRATLPNAPLTSIAFRTVQYCTNYTTASPTPVITPWEGAEAPTLKLVPARLPGWNKYTINTAIADIAALKAYFSDSHIVWSGGSAWSVNPVTDALITNKLTTIPANQEFWVKY